MRAVVLQVRTVLTVRVLVRYCNVLYDYLPTVFLYVVGVAS